MLKRLVAASLRRFGLALVRTSDDARLGPPLIARGKDIIRRISPDFAVLNGPFQGLRYPSLDITEATLTPKIVGSYESPLHPTLRDIMRTPYTDVIDVGCAEGYYAVGFAMKMPQATIHAFDINEHDLQFSRRMAELNRVSNISFNHVCDPVTLAQFDFGAKGLVFCDCEGYELDLFTPEVVHALTDRNVDVLVELHDVLRHGVTSTLVTRFKCTHDIRFVSTKDKQICPWAGLESLSPHDQAFAIFEHRGGVNKDIYMEWAFFTKK